jgi:hypothetical protein
MSRSRAFHLIPSLGLVLITTLFVVYYYELGMDARFFLNNQKLLKVQEARIQWGVSSVVLSIALVWNLGVAIVIIRQETEALSRFARRWLWVVLLGIIALTCSFLLNFEVGGATGAFMRLSAASGRPIINYIQSFGNLLGAAVVILVVASVSCLPSGALNLSLHALSAKVRAFSISLYSSSALLAIAVFEIYSIFHFGAISIDKPSKILMSLATTLAASAGALFSVILLTAYAPVAMQLDAAIRAALREAMYADTNLDSEQWRSRNDLETSPLNLIGSYVAMVAPVLVGGLTKLLKG